MDENKSSTEIKKGNNNTGILWGIIIILLILLGGCVYLLLNKETPKDQKEVVDKENKQDVKEEKLQEIGLDDSLVEESLKLIPHYTCGGVAINLDKKDKNIQDLSNDEKLSMILSIYSSDIMKTAMDESNYTISETELNKYFDSLSFLDEFRPALDSSVTIEGKASHGGAKTAKGLIIPSYIRFNDGKIIITAYGTGCEGPRSDGDVLEPIKAEKNSDTLIIEFLHYYQKFLDFDENKNTFLYNIYQTKDDYTPIKTISDEEFETIIQDKAKFDTYKVSINIKDGNRILKSIKYSPATN